MPHTIQPADEAAFSIIKTMTDKPTKLIPCENCNGLGYFPETDNICPVCKGAGAVPVEEKEDAE